MAWGLGLGLQHEGLGVKVWVFGAKAWGSGFRV